MKLLDLKQARLGGFEALGSEAKLDLGDLKLLGVKQARLGGFEALGFEAS